MRRSVPWLKPHSTPVTLKWLDLNYQPADGFCIPRNALYKEYVEFSRLNQMQPVNAASFGKIIRQKFPTLTTRRLGTRGQSKYHYYGLTLKLNCISYTMTDFNRNSHPPDTSNDFSPPPAIKSLNLPLLPSRELISSLPPGDLRNNLETVLDVYVSHCKRIASHALQFQHSQMCQEISDFWREFLSPFTPFLEDNSILSLLGACDAIIYHAISQNMFPCILWRGFNKSWADGLFIHWEQALQLAENALSFTSIAVQGGPDGFIRLKTCLSRNFLLNIQSQASLSNICYELLTLLEQEGNSQKVVDDWNTIDVVNIAKEALPSRFKKDTTFGTDLQSIILSNLFLFSESFKTTKSSQPQDMIKSLMSWSNKLTGDVLRLYSTFPSSNRHCDVDVGFRKSSEKREIIEEAYQIWNRLGSLILRELNLNGSSHYGTFKTITVLLKTNAEQLLQSLMSSELIHRLLENVSSGKNIQEVEVYLCPVGQGFPFEMNNFKRSRSTDRLTEESVVAVTSLSSQSRKSSGNEQALLRDDKPFRVCPMNGSMICRSELCNSGFEFNNSFCQHGKYYPVEETDAQEDNPIFDNYNFQIPRAKMTELELDTTHTRPMNLPILEPTDEPIQSMSMPTWPAEGFQHNMLSFHESITIDTEHPAVANCIIEDQIEHSHSDYAFQNENEQFQQQQVVPDSDSYTLIAMPSATGSNQTCQPLPNLTYFNFYDQEQFAEQERDYQSLSPYPTTQRSFETISTYMHDKHF